MRRQVSSGLPRGNEFWDKGKMLGTKSKWQREWRPSHGCEPGGVVQ